MSTDYNPVIEQNASTMRFFIGSPQMIPVGIWFNIDRTVSELLDYLCETHAVFRGEAVSREDRATMYPIYALDKAYPIDSTVLDVIYELPRYDARTNRLIKQVVKEKKSYVDRFQAKMRLLGRLVAPDEILRAIIEPSFVDYRSLGPSTTIIIGVPVVEIIPENTPGPSILTSFIKEKFAWSNSRSRSEQHSFKDRAVDFYNSADPNDKSKLFDASTGIYAAKEILVAGHIFKSEWKNHWDAFWKDSTSKAEDPRNSIIWNIAVEHAFDNGRITVYEDNNVLRFHIMDPRLARIKVAADLMGTDRAKSIAQAVYGNLTFGDLEGKALCFRNEARPFRRCLCLHAKVTRLAAIYRGWHGAEEWDLDSYYSEDGVDLNVAHFLSRISTEYSRRSSVELLPEQSKYDDIFDIAEHRLSRKAEVDRFEETENTQRN